MEDIEELENWSSEESFSSSLELQKNLFYSQIELLQQIVVAQCKLTGVNPLSQEMAAGALSIQIGKKPRDLLNPKAVNYMQSVFSIKDGVNKKECREISAQFGISITQVRDFFNSQRTRLRKMIRLSTEKSSRILLPKAQVFDVGRSSSSHIETDTFEPKALHSVTLNSAPAILNFDDDYPSNLSCSNRNCQSMVGCETCSINKASADIDPLNCSEPTSTEESSLEQNNNLIGLVEFEEEFVTDIFILLRKEDTFNGQVKLLERILQIQNSSVLNWFLMEGGALVLTTWLGLATSEEQTSVIYLILRVFCFLPLQNCLPEHMSSILQSVNKLRYYRTSDISNRARVLLSKWCKMFSRSQDLKRTNGTKLFTSAQEMSLKQSIEEVMGDELLQSFERDSCQMLPLPPDNPESMRKVEPPHVVKLLAAPFDEASKKHVLGILAANSKKRRKVQLVDQQGQSTSNKSVQTHKIASNTSRPMSADDIQKAKMRALYKQSKYGKNAVSLDGSNLEAANKMAKISVAKPVIRSAEGQCTETLKSAEKRPDRKADSKEMAGSRIKAQISWHTPPEMLLKDAWRVGNGESCKELEVQRNRNRREMEILYCTIHDIPSNPREPWDSEMDYDDSLTPEIPIEQPPDDQIPPNDPPIASTSGPISSQNASSEPDLELLAALLKNPEIVFALTSGQGGNLSRDDTVRLLDMIKTSGSAVESKPEVSLPSPTPSTTATNGWRPAASSNPFSRPRQVPTFREGAMKMGHVASPSSSAVRAGQGRGYHVMVPQNASGVRSGRSNGGRKATYEDHGFESWSPENSPSRRSHGTGWINNNDQRRWR